MDPLTIFAALAPLVVEGGKAAISRWIAPKEFKPSTVDQWMQMQELQLRWFTALQDAGGKGQTYQWVEASVRLMRPFIAAIVMLTWADAHGFLWNDPQTETISVDNFASAIGFYLFGDRSLFYAKKITAK